MDDTEAKVRCLELAATLNKPSGNYDAGGVVKTATVLYSFINPSSEQGEQADKSRKGKAAKVA